MKKMSSLGFMRMAEGLFEFDNEMEERINFLLSNFNFSHHVDLPLKTNGYVSMVSMMHEGIEIIEMIVHLNWEKELSSQCWIIGECTSQKMRNALNGIKTIIGDIEKDHDLSCFGYEKGDNCWIRKVNNEIAFEVSKGSFFYDARSLMKQKVIPKEFNGVLFNTPFIHFNLIHDGEKIPMINYLGMDFKSSIVDFECNGFKLFLDEKRFNPEGYGELEHLMSLPSVLRDFKTNPPKKQILDKGCFRLVLKEGMNAKSVTYDCLNIKEGALETWR